MRAILKFAGVILLVGVLLVGGVTLLRAVTSGGDRDDYDSDHYDTLEEERETPETEKDDSDDEESSKPAKDEQTEEDDAKAEEPEDDRDEPEEDSEPEVQNTVSPGSGNLSDTLDIMNENFDNAYDRIYQEYLDALEELEEDESSGGGSYGSGYSSYGGGYSSYGGGYGDSSAIDSGPEQCLACKGLGSCNICDGSGRYSYLGVTTDCNACGGSGNCWKCGGSGYTSTKMVPRKDSFRGTIRFCGDQPTTSRSLGWWLSTSQPVSVTSTRSSMRTPNLPGR